MVIRIKKKLYFKPRRCPDCGKKCYFCKCHLSQRCRTCHNMHHRLKKHLKIKELRAKGWNKYNTSYQRRRNRLIKQHPYCALCGTDQNLTAHHVGGGTEHLTILCDDCHQAYERYRMKKKAKRICKLAIQAFGKIK